MLGGNPEFAGGWDVQTNILRSYFGYCSVTSSIEGLFVVTCLIWSAVNEVFPKQMMIWNVVYFARLLIKLPVQYIEIKKMENFERPKTEQTILKFIPILQWILFIWAFHMFQENDGIAIECPILSSLTIAQIVLFFTVAFRPVLVCFGLPIIALLSLPFIALVWCFFPGVGATQDQLDEIPEYTYGDDGAPQPREDTCAICISKYEKGEIYRVLPCSGHHDFHKDCIDVWLSKKAKCPFCRDWIIEPPAYAQD